MGCHGFDASPLLPPSPSSLLCPRGTAFLGGGATGMSAPMASFWISLNFLLILRMSLLNNASAWETGSDNSFCQPTSAIKIPSLLR